MQSQDPASRYVDRSLPTRVLAIDGGGVRAMLPARVLAELEWLTAKPTAELFDIVAATSSGALLAAALTLTDGEGRARYRAEEVMELLTSRAAELFGGGGRRWWSRPFPGGHPRHRAESLERLLDECLGQAPFGRTLCRMIVPAYDIDAAGPLVFDSVEFSDRADPLMADIVRASFAAPGYFAPARVAIAGTDRCFLDGGLVANNPAMIGYAAALQQAMPANVVLVSLGSGTRARTGAPPVGRSAFRRHETASAAGLFSLVEQSSSESQHQMLQVLLSCLGGLERYWRVETSVHGCSAALDDASPSNLACLRAVADEMVQSPANNLVSLAYVLTGQRPPAQRPWADRVR